MISFFISGFNSSKDFTFLFSLILFNTIISISFQYISSSKSKIYHSNNFIFFLYTHAQVYTTPSIKRFIL